MNIYVEYITNRTTQPEPISVPVHSENYGLQLAQTLRKTHGITHVRVVKREK